MYSPYSPHSPFDGVYNTPDVSLPTVREILQRIRLESVLRRAGLLPCCKTSWEPVDVTHALHVPRRAKLENISSLETSLQGQQQTDIANIKAQERQDYSIQTDKKCKCPKSHIKHKQLPPKENVVKHHSYRIVGDKPRKTCPIVTDTYYRTRSVYDASQDYYRPFCPPRPAKLPSIPKDSTANKSPKCRSKDCAMKSELERETKRESERWKYPGKKQRRNRQMRREQEFREWTVSQENYYGKPLDFDLYDAPLFNAQDKLHNANINLRGAQDIYRDVGLTYINLGQNIFQRHLLLPKIDRPRREKTKKNKKTTKNMKSK